MNEPLGRYRDLTALLRWIGVLCLIALRPASLAADKPDGPREPFKSVILRGDVIIATLQPEWRRLVRFNKEPARRSEPGESFTFRVGDTLYLTEYHRSYWTYEVTPRFSPTPAGLVAKCTYDPAPALGRRTRNGKFHTQTLFIPAKEQIRK